MASKINPLRLKASDIRDAMRKRWKDPEWAVMWEVNEATGARSGRSADAVMMSLWPSRGLELHGVEIKVSRSDWKREAADPRKAEAVAKYCDRWWVHTPVGVVDDVSDMPPAWGLREFDGKQWNTVKEAERTEALPMDRTFLASILRRADDLMRVVFEDAKREAAEANVAEMESLRQSHARRVEDAVARRTRDLADSAEKVALYEGVFGEEVSRRWGDRPQGPRTRVEVAGRVREERVPRLPDSREASCRSRLHRRTGKYDEDRRMSRQKTAVVAGSAHGYSVVDQVIRNPKGKVLKGTLGSSGYWIFNVNVPGILPSRGVSVYVHQMVAYQEFGSIFLEDGMEVRHLNGNRLDNSVGNIAMGTRLQNIMDMTPTQRSSRSLGRVSEKRVLTDEEADMVRCQYKGGIRRGGCKDLATRLGVNMSTISEIGNGKTYVNK